MNVASYILLAAIAAWAVFSAVYPHRHGSCTSCTGCSSCTPGVSKDGAEGCSGSCGSCPYHQAGMHSRKPDGPV